MNDMIYVRKNILGPSGKIYKLIDESQEITYYNGMTFINILCIYKRPLFTDPATMLLDFTVMKTNPIHFGVIAENVECHVSGWHTSDCKQIKVIICIAHKQKQNIQKHKTCSEIWEDEPEQKEPKHEGFVPETLEWCERHYVPVSRKHIHCPDFGKCDGMNGSCWWCMEMMPYQWNMCSDESWLRSLMKPCKNGETKSRDEAAMFIEKRKISKFKKNNSGDLK